MRTRTTVTGDFSTINTRTVQSRSSCAAGWVTTSTVTSYTGEQSTKTIVDVQTPGFYSLLKCGKFLPLNPVTITTSKETRVAGTGTESWGFSGGCYRSQDIGPKWSAPSWLVTLPPFDESIIDQVVTTAISRAREATWDALTSVVTLNQTVDLFVDTFDSVNTLALRAARYARSRHKNPRDILRLFASKWLEYRYGWLPTLYDLEDANKALDRKIEVGDIITGKSSVDTDLNDSQSGTTWFSIGDHSQTDSLIGTRTYHGSSYCEAMSNAVRYGIDPITTAWEVVPYSFVIDWFLDVGTWLSAVSPFSGAKELGSMASVKDQYTLMTSDVWEFNRGGHSGSFTGRSTVLEVEQYSRFPHEGGVLPSWNPRITPARIIDLISLVFAGRRNVIRALR
jgi:hypothetical protein